MKIVYHDRFTDCRYADDPAASKGRIQCIVEEVREEDGVEFVKPEPVSEQDIRLVHSPDFLNELKGRDKKLYEMSRLSAGGAVKAAEIACEGEPAFALIRPPGHHASPESRWGFCYLNNMAIASKRLMSDEKIDSAFILDFDLHKGDGNLNCLKEDQQVTIFNPISEGRERYMEEVREELKRSGDQDIIGISAGFDEHVMDWGGKLRTEDFEELGELIKEYSKDKCENRRFALLEGGYNREVLGENVVAFLKGFKD